MTTSETGAATAFTKEHTRIVKGIAVLMLLFHHLFNDYPEYEGHFVNYWPFTGDQVTAIALACRVCVAVFVFATGYGLAASFENAFPQGDRESRREMARFSLSRWWSLMTRFWFVVVIAWVAGTFLGRSPFVVYGPGIGGTIARAFVDFMGLAEAFQSDRLNPTWWYMSLALLLIFAAPLVMSAAKRFGALALLVTYCLVMGCLKIETATVVALPSFFFGVYCYEQRVFDRWMGLWCDSRWGIPAKSVLLLVCIFCLLLFRENYNYIGVLDAILAALLCAVVTTCVCKIPYVSGALRVLGRHSDNMFFTHTLLYSYYFLDFYYSFQIPVIILAVLAATTLLLSWVLELIKDKSGYNIKMARLGKRVVNLLAA